MTRGGGAFLEKGPPSPLMLPSPFPKLLLWSPAGGVTPQAEKRWQSPGEDGGRHDWPCSGIKSARSQRPGAFALAGWGLVGRVSSTVYHGIHLGQSGAAVQGAGGGLRDALVPCSKDVQTRGARSGTDRAPLVWRSFIRRRGPACRSEEKVLEERGKGRPGPCPLRRRKLRASRAGWREDLFPEKVSLPLSFPFESDVTTYSCARPMPGRAASRPAPRRKRPASSKALPMSCMPTGILLSAAMPTGRDRPGRPARFRDRV